MVSKDQKYTSVRKLQRRSRASILICLVVLIILGVIFRWDIYFQTLLSKKSEVSLIELSNAERYKEVVDQTVLIIKRDPLNSEALFFQGVAYFYQALLLGDSVNQKLMLDEAIIALRRSLLDPELKEKSEAKYLLGKAYFHKGKFYYDLAIKYLLESLSKGYEGGDTYEYIGLSYVRLKELNKGLDYLTIGVEKRPSDLLYLSISEIYKELSYLDKAIYYLNTALEATNDLTVELRSRFLLGEVFLMLDRFEDARYQFELIVMHTPNLPEVLVLYGDAYAGLGDLVRARAEWRKARSIDSEDVEANLRLRR